MRLNSKGQVTIPLISGTSTGCAKATRSTWSRTVTC